MAWKALLLLIIPAVTGWLALRRSGVARGGALVATLASAVYALIMAVPALADRVPGMAVMAIFAVGLVAVLVMMAGPLERASQWACVGLGALAIAGFFAGFGALLLETDGLLAAAEAGLAPDGAAGPGPGTALFSSGAAASLLPLGALLITGAPRLIGQLHELRGEIAGGRAAREPLAGRGWSPAQWASLGLGLAILAVGVALAARVPEIEEGPGVFVAVGGVVIAALGPRLVGLVGKRR